MEHTQHKGVQMIELISKFAQSSYNYDYSYSTSTPDPAAAAFGFGILLFILVAVVLAYIFFAVCYTKIFKKAGRQDAWAGWIPIYNTYVFFEVAGRPGWWAFLTFIPVIGSFASIITTVIASFDMAKSFGRDTGYGLLLAFVPVVGYPMLAFGSATYQGAVGPEGRQAPVVPPQPPQMPQQPPQPPVQPIQ